MKNSEKLSLGETKIVHGIEVKKMPCGAYFKAIQTMKELPNNFFEELKEDNQELKLSEMLDMKNIGVLISRMLIVFPQFMFHFLSELMGVDKNKLTEELTPTEVCDVVEEFWKLNDLQSFFVKMKSATTSIMKTLGFKN